MDLDNITDVEWFRKQLKIYCTKVIKDIPNTNFKAGNYYKSDQDGYGVWLFDWNSYDGICLCYDECAEYLEGV